MGCNLTDDGTLDTVFTCDTCGEEIRYSSDGMERSEDEDIDALEAQATEEHTDECLGNPDEPQAEDYTISDARGGGYSVGQHEGRHIGVYETRKEAENAIRKHAGGSFFPNVWIISDHGNPHLAEGFNWTEGS